MAMEMCDHADAKIINNAWQAMGDVFHRSLLMFWYVDSLSREFALIDAYREANRDRPRTLAHFPSCLAMAHALINAQLDAPAVIRRTRVELRIRNVIGPVIDPLVDRFEKCA